MVGVPHLTGKQKIYTAIVILVCEPGGVDDRLKAAYETAIASVDPQLDLPPDLAGDFTKIRDELRREFVFPSKPRPEKERRHWATSMATKIVSFYDVLARSR